MQSISTSGAETAPSPIAHRRATRVTKRVAVSPEMAGVIAGLAWGSRRRDDDVLLVALTASRCGAAGAMGHVHG